MEPAEVRVGVPPRAGLAGLVVVVTTGALLAVAMVVLSERQPLGLLQAASMVLICVTSVHTYRAQQRLDPLRLLVGPAGLSLQGGPSIPWAEVDEIRYRRPRAPLSWFGSTGSVAVVQASQTRFAARAGVRPDATVLSTRGLDHTAAQVMDAIALHAPPTLRAGLPAPWGVRGAGDGSAPQDGVDAGQAP